MFFFETQCTYRISCSTLPIFRRDAVVASAHWLPVFSTSARRDVLLSAIGRLLRPALDFGTVYLLMSGLPRHSQHFVKSWKPIYFRSLTQTLFYNTLRHIQSCGEALQATRWSCVTWLQVQPWCTTGRLIAFEWRALFDADNNGFVGKLRGNG